jgi:hypothetical protein
MWRRNAVSLALVLATALSTERSDAQQDQPVLLSNQHWVRFEIVLGRITATYLRGGRGQRTCEEAGESLQERLTVNGGSLKPSIRYECHDNTRHVLIEVVNRTEVKISSSPNTPTEGRVVCLQQKSDLPVELVVGNGQDAQHYRAPSIWHLLLGERDVCREHLLPLMAMMRPDWQLNEAAFQIEYELFRIARTRSNVSRHHVSQLVEQLDHDSFSSRQSADRELRHLGVSILPYLQRLDSALLNNEQRMRINRIEAYLMATGGDSAARVAAWLVHDKAIWLDLLTHHEPLKREAAASHLTGIHAGQIQFDPHAEENHRNEQIARLRLRIVGY